MSAVTTQPRGGLSPTLRGRGRGAPRARGLRGRVRTASPLGRQVVNHNVSQNGFASAPVFQEMKADKTSFEQLKKAREKERADAIARGLIDDPDKPKRLDQAITFIGTCQDMCPAFERVTRIVQNNVDSNEKEPTEISGTPVQQKFVKEFRRSAAGIEAPLPSDVRPPPILSKTLIYLMSDVLGGPRPLSRTHKFLWSRTRSIRQDFTFQNVNKVSDLLIAVECFEKIARFHILSLHLMSDPLSEDGGFSHQQEREQLYKTLTSLMYFYEDCRQKNAKPPNETEFRAYYIIAHIRDQDIERQAQLWPTDVLDHPRVQTALELYNAIQNIHDFHGTLVAGQSEVGQNFYQRFWRVIQSNKVSYLLGCLAETHFNHVRKLALTAILAGFRTPQVVQDWTLSELVDCLGYDTEQEVHDFCVAYGLTVANGVYLVLSGNVEDPSPPLPQRLSLQVEQKRKKRTMPAVVAGLTVHQAIAQGLIKEEQSLFVEERGRTTNNISGFTTGFSPGFNNGLNSGITPNTGPDPGTPFQFGGATPSSGPFARPVEPFNPFTSKPATPDPFAKSEEPFNPFSKPSQTVASFSPFQKPLDASTPPFNPFQPISNTSKPGISNPFQKSAEVAANPFEMNTPVQSLLPGIVQQDTIKVQSTTSSLDSKPLNPFHNKSSDPTESPKSTAEPAPKSPFIFGQQTSAAKPATFLFGQSNGKTPADEPAKPLTSKTPLEKPADTPETSKEPQRSLPGFNFPSPFAAGDKVEEEKPGPAFAPAVPEPPKSLFDRISKPTESATKPTDPIFKPPEQPPAPSQSLLQQPPLLSNSLITPPELSILPEPEPERFIIETSPEPETEPPSSEFAEWFLFGEGGLFDQLVEHNWKYFQKKATRQLEDSTAITKAVNFRERVLMERYFYRWKERAYQSRLRRRGRRRRTQTRSDTHWAPVQYRALEADLEQAAEARRTIYKPYNIGKIFSGEVSKALSESGIPTATWGVLCYNSDDKADYWWRTKFVGGDNVPVQLDCDESTACVIFGCSADYSVTNEVRFHRDALALHQVVHKAAARTSYENLILLVICYRSPLDQSDLAYDEVDIERLSQVGRTTRRSAIMKALRFSDLPKNIVGREVALIETKEDLDLRPALRVVRGLILTTINPVLAKYRSTKRDGTLVNGEHEESPAPKRSRISSDERQRLSLPNMGSRRMPSTASVASSVSSTSSRRYNWSGDFATPGFTRASSSMSQRLSQSQRSQSELSESWLRESRQLLQNLNVRPRPLPKIELPAQDRRNGASSVLQRLRQPAPAPVPASPSIILLDSDDDEPKPTQKSQLTVADEDDELFAQARRIRSAMDEDSFMEDMY